MAFRKITVLSALFMGMISFSAFSIPVYVDGSQVNSICNDPFSPAKYNCTNHDRRLARQFLDQFICLIKWNTTDKEGSLIVTMDDIRFNKDGGIEFSYRADKNGVVSKLKVLNRYTIDVVLIYALDDQRADVKNESTRIYNDHLLEVVKADVILNTGLAFKITEKKYKYSNSSLEKAKEEGIHTQFTIDKLDLTVALDCE